jgi:hypothetical protein
VLDLNKCQSLVNVLGTVHDCLEADVQGSLVELELVQSWLWSTETAAEQAKLKLSVAMECLEELKNSD